MKQNPFEQKKKHILQQIELTDEDHHDASPKGTIDAPLLPLIHLINENKDMFTTSSCSGRVSVFLEGDRIIAKSGNQENNTDNTSDDKTVREKIGGKGAGGKWLFVTHNPDDLQTENWLNKIKHYQEDYYSDTDVQVTKRYLLYKFEAMILHVKCRNKETANKLYTIAMGCGFRETGIGSNDLVGIRISIKLDVPLGYFDQTTGKIKFLVSDEYIHELDKMSLARFQENFRRMDQLYQAIKTKMI